MTEDGGQSVGKEVRNEKRKLTAAYLNNLAVGIMIAGLIVPYFACFSPTSPMRE
jgi:hypothetical protein